MINKDKLKGLISGIILASLFGTTVFAAPVEKQITAIYDNIKLYIDGELVQPKDANGNEVEPVVIAGTTYVPIRAVGQAFEKEVSWDEERSSVYIGKQPTTEQKEVIVSNVDEFVSALGSNKHIKLQPGIYNLSNISDRDNHVSSILWAPVQDGYELNFNEFNNLTIEGLGDSPVDIVTDSRFANIFSFLSSNKISLRNLRLGHTIIKNYECNAGVVRFGNTYDINIDNCILYGCGSQGISTNHVSNLLFQNSIIEDCNFCIMSVSNSENISFKDSTFRNCKYASMFNFYKAEKIVYDNCLIEGNKTTDDYYSFIDSSNSIVKFLNCKFKNNTAKSFKKLQISNIDFIGSTFEGNSFDSSK